MKLSINDVARIIQAKVAGDGSFFVCGVSSFDDATYEQITFAIEPNFLKKLSLTKAKAIIVPDSFAFKEGNIENKILLKSKTPRISFFKLVDLFHPVKKMSSSINPRSCIGKDVKIGNHPIIGANTFIGDQVTIGNNVRLMPGVYIGDNVSIGDGTVIKPNVTIMEKTLIGKNVIIHSGSVIGSDGFGFAQNGKKHHKLIHIGYVSIGDDTEIGACNTIDRGTLGVTQIGCGVKTDNQVHIAHNVKVGDHTLIVAQVGIAGSTHIGENVIIAGKAAITGHIKVGNNSIIGPCAGVISDVPENEIVSGIPHMPHRKWLKMNSISARLPDMRKKIFSIEKRLKNIEHQNKRTE